MKVKYEFKDNRKFYWIQIVHAIAGILIEIFLVRSGNITNPIIHGHRLIKKDQIYCLEMLNNREIYSM